MLTIAFWILVGYAICVLFPMPYLSSAILTFWQKVGAWLASFKGTPAPTPVANTVTTVTK